MLYFYTTSLDHNVVRSVAAAASVKLLLDGNLELTSPHLISPHLKLLSPHLTSLNLTTPHLTFLNEYFAIRIDSNVNYSLD